MFKRILVAVDHASARALLKQAIDLATTQQASLMIQHVFSVFDEGYAGSFYPGIDTLYPTLHGPMLQSYAQEWERAEIQDLSWLKSLRDEAEQAGVRAEYHQVLGDPGVMICQSAKTWNADLILVGRRGRSGLSELLLGSVSNYVLHHAPCSVLTLQGSSASADQLSQDQSERELASTR
jgi:nucleotide-binding universal stress UspA family protein